jgi:hypothetical protein
MSPAPETDSLLSRGADWFIAGVFCTAGLLVAFGPGLLDLSPEYEKGLHQGVLYGLCLFMAYVYLQVRRLRRRVVAAEDLLADVRFGPGTKRDRDAVDILLHALRTSDANARETALRTLRKITGLDLGEDPRPWEEWWSVARNTFVRMGGAPGGSPAEKK